MNAFELAHLCFDKVSVLMKKSNHTATSQTLCNNHQLDYAILQIQKLKIQVGPE
ncbi:MAG: hypothetical protein H0A76_13465 [Candidatus Thiodubiliella endoseptemdiera]|uniref:Uncharacterized protein n=1 Tax=Candidatus Thiodubiliella endoseptemdiera TaxID=2738886 RepID=A0A853F5V3_9GAMM|nr:hypothetical protein [Candidatus Thiodubiliella endoseptemdiera]